MGFKSCSPSLAWDIVKSTIGITTVKTTYQSVFTANMDVDHFIIQLSNLMAAAMRSETNALAKDNMVQMPYANLPETPVTLNSASKH